MARRFLSAAGGDALLPPSTRVMWLVLPALAALLYGALASPIDALPPTVQARPSATEVARDSTRGTSPDVVKLAPHPEQDATREASHDPLRPAREEDYLRRLDALSVSDKAQALAYARVGADWFGDSGVGAEAREAKSITLLVDLGRMDEARDEVRVFIEQHPDSRYRPLVQGVTGIHPRPTRSDYP